LLAEAAPPTPSREEYLAEAEEEEHGSPLLAEEAPPTPSREEYLAEAKEEEPGSPLLAEEAPPTPSRDEYLAEAEEKEQAEKPNLAAPAPTPSDAMLKEAEALTTATEKLSSVIDELHDHIEQAPAMEPPVAAVESTPAPAMAPPAMEPPSEVEPPPAVKPPVTPDSSESSVDSSESSVALLRPKFCFDSMFDGNETDVDCGGSCKPCAAGMDCLYSKDCTSGVCEDQECTADSVVPVPGPVPTTTEEVPIVEPTEDPTEVPTAEPTEDSTEVPTAEPTGDPTAFVSDADADAASESEDAIGDQYYFGFAGPLWSSSKPTSDPTENPTAEPTGEPTAEPTEGPTTPSPTKVPTEAPSIEPTESPTDIPTDAPTDELTDAPTSEPTLWEPPAPTPQPPTISPQIPFPEESKFAVRAHHNIRAPTHRRCVQIDVVPTFDVFVVVRTHAY
jgi:hypothetical protein